MADFGKLPTYPSPKRTLTLSSYLGQTVGVGEGWQFRLQEDAIFVTVVINWKCWRLFQLWFTEIRIQPVTRRSEKSRLSMERTYFFVRSGNSFEVARFKVRCCGTYWTSLHSLLRTCKGSAWSKSSPVRLACKSWKAGVLPIVRRPGGRVVENPGNEVEANRRLDSRERRECSLIFM